MGDGVENHKLGSSISKEGRMKSQNLVFGKKSGDVDYMGFPHTLKHQQKKFEKTGDSNITNRSIVVNSTNEKEETMNAKDGSVAHTRDNSMLLAEVVHSEGNIAPALRFVVFSLNDISHFDNQSKIQHASLFCKEEILLTF